MHSFSDKKTASSSSPSKMIIILVCAAVLLGVGTGYFLARSSSTGTGPLAGKIGNSAALPAGKVLGNGDPKVFKDTAEGVLTEGGINGEGQFHLVRPGGDSQNVYMTSGNVDLAQLVGRKIKVWGQTQKAQTAGWLMDVGKVEVQ